MSRIRRTSAVPALLISAWLALASGSLAIGAAAYPCDTPCSDCQPLLLFRAVDCCCLVAPAEPAPAGSTHQSVPAGTDRHDQIVAGPATPLFDAGLATRVAPSPPRPPLWSAPPSANLVLRI